jgi:hypothetical protein
MTGLSFYIANCVRLSIDKTIIPLPVDLTTSPQYLATVTTEAAPFQLSVNVPDKSTHLSNSEFEYTDEPNCFQDQYGYAYNLEKNSNNKPLNY